jgi:hypothetical protein
LSNFRFCGKPNQSRTIYSTVEILTRFSRCWLGTQNLNPFVLIYKNCPNDPCFDCETFVGVKFFDDFENVETKFLDQIEEEFEDQLNHYVELIDITYFDF